MQFLVAFLFAAAPTLAAQRSIPIKIFALNHRLYFGSAINMSHVKTDVEYAHYAEKEFSILTPENEFKFIFIHPKKNEFKFDVADSLVEFAKKNHQLVRGHTLVWHNEAALPRWVSRSKLSPEELKMVLRNHIEQTVRHFRKTAKKTVISWDVVNEAFDDSGNFRSDSIWAPIAKNPFEFFKLVFTWTHQANPKALLFYNDYGIEEQNAKSNAVYALIKKLKRAGVRIDGIGIQMHERSDQEFDSHKVQKNLRRFALLGLKIHITEYDYAITDAPGEQEKQAQGYARAMKACLSESHCTAFLTWGFGDAYLWPGNFQNGFGQATFLDKNLKPKPAYFALKKTVSEFKARTISDPNRNTHSNKF